MRYKLFYFEPEGLKTLINTESKDQRQVNVQTFFDAWPAYSKVETTDCRAHMFLLRLFNSMPAAIPTMLAGGGDFFDLIGCAAACRMASKVGALVLSSVMRSSHLKSVILSSEDTRSTEGTGLSRQSEPHSTLMIWRIRYTVTV